MQRISRQTERTGIHGKKINILQYFDKPANNDLTFTDLLRPSPQTIETELVKWILHIRSLGAAVTDELIICKAEDLIEKTDPPINCKLSNGWIDKFKHRHNIVSRKAGSKIVRINDRDKKTLTDFVTLVNTKITSKKYFSRLYSNQNPEYIEENCNQDHTK
jgi:hypothetical protein